MDSIVTLKNGKVLELSRKIMNDCMDLIYQVGHKKTALPVAKKKIQDLLRRYFFDGTESLTSENLNRLEHHFDSLVFMTHSLLEKIDTQKEPLYKTIVKMNQLLVSTKKLKENFIQRQEKSSSEKNVAKRVVVEPALLTFKDKKIKKEAINMKTQDVKKSHESINYLINEVLEQKKKLKESVVLLNKSLENVGFELRELDAGKN